MTADVEGALQVHGDDCVPFLLAHVEDHAVAQNAGRIDDDINAAQLAHGTVNHGAHSFMISHAAVVGDGAAAARCDIIYNALRCARILSFAVHAGADVVDDDC